MQQVWPTVLALVAILIGLIAGFLAEGLMLAGSPNSSPAQLHVIKLTMIGIAVVTLLCATVAVILLTRHYPWAAAGVGIAPAVLAIIGLVVALI